MNESRFKCQVVTLLKKQLPVSYVYHPSDRWNSGVPDLLVLYRGTFAAIELKVGKNTATKIQLTTLQRIGEAGGITAVCRTMDEVRAVIQKILLSVNQKDGKRRN